MNNQILLKRLKCTFSCKGDWKNTYQELSSEQLITKRAHLIKHQRWITAFLLLATVVTLYVLRNELSMGIIFIAINTNSMVAIYQDYHKRIKCIDQILESRP